MIKQGVGSKSFILVKGLKFSLSFDKNNRCYLKFPKIHIINFRKILKIYEIINKITKNRVFYTLNFILCKVITERTHKQMLICKVKIPFHCIFILIFNVLKSILLICKFTRNRHILMERKIIRKRYLLVSAKTKFIRKCLRLTTHIINYLLFFFN